MYKLRRLPDVPGLSDQPCLFEQLRSLTDLQWRLLQFRHQPMHAGYRERDLREGGRELHELREFFDGNRMPDGCFLRLQRARRLSSRRRLQPDDTPVHHELRRWIDVRGRVLRFYELPTFQLYEMQRRCSADVQQCSPVGKRFRRSGSMRRRLHAWGVAPAV